MLTTKISWQCTWQKISSPHWLFSKRTIQDWFWHWPVLPTMTGPIVFLHTRDWKAPPAESLSPSCLWTMFRNFLSESPHSQTSYNQPQQFHWFLHWEVLLPRSPLYQDWFTNHRTGTESFAWPYRRTLLHKKPGFHIYISHPPHQTQNTAPWWTQAIHNVSSKHFHKLTM